ncbi:MAG: ATP-dependent DNA ligase [Candidatus Lokiarchaeota archaeon]|nr:ATP-dependent DNA ligase [Candidatus Lokiarchaeota archaeon]
MIIMKFKYLATLFSKLESTSKRLEMIDLLSDFFNNIKKEANFEDIDKIVYLLQGRLISNIKQFPKMGLAEKMIIEAVALHSGIEGKKIRDILLKMGDIGAAAEYVLSKKKKQKSLFDYHPESDLVEESIEISELYSELKKIALTEGAGSNDVKLGILRGLMRQISPLETKYLLRIITSTLRVGIQTPTIIEGLALSFTNSRETKDIIEKAYSLHPDLGDITNILAKKGLDAVKLVDIEYKTPILSMLASREIYTEFISRLGTPFIAEYKLDGERLQIHKVGGEVILFSRRLLDVSEQYPDVCKVVRENIQANKVIFEGEVVAMDNFYEKMLPFQVLSKRRRKYDVEDISKEVPVCLFVFDLLKYEETSYIDKSLPVRRKQLEEIVNERDELKLVKQVLIHSTEELLNFFKEARKVGTEGVMAKSINEDSIYQAGNRGFKWLKLKGLEGGKLKDSVDVVLVGAFYGRGRRKGVYGTYIGAVYDAEHDKFEAFTRIASGWTDDIMESLTEEMKNFEINQKDPKVNCDDKPDQWLKPEIVIEIIGDEITISDKFSSLGYSLRFPVFQRLRPDKGIKDITTVDEIENLYNTQ